MTTVGPQAPHSGPELIAFLEITIDGDTNVSFTEDVEARYKSYGWNVLHVENGNE